jgi:hypothetical protein
VLTVEPGRMGCVEYEPISGTFVGYTPLPVTCRHQNKCRRCEYKEQVFYTLFPDTKRSDTKSAAVIISLQTVDG